MSPPASVVPVHHRIVNQGVTLAGRAFRPSDWAERLCGIMSTFGHDQQMRCSPFVRPMMLDGVRCVVVEPSLLEAGPRAYRFLLDFARDNELIVIDPTQPAGEDFCPLPGSALESLVRQVCAIGGARKRRPPKRKPPIYVVPAEDTKSAVMARAGLKPTPCDNYG